MLKGVKLLEDEAVLKGIEDPDLKSYYFNNSAIGNFWIASNKMSGITQEKLNYELISDLSKFLASIINKLKQAISLVEGIQIGLGEAYEYENKIASSPGYSRDIDIIKYLHDNEAESKILKEDMLKYLVSTSLEKNPKISKKFLEIYKKIKKPFNIVGSPTSSFIMGNLGEIYFKLNDFEKAFIFINSSNHLNPADSKSHFKCLTYLSYIDKILSRSTVNSDKMLSKVISSVRDLPPSPEISVIYRLYYDYLSEINPNLPLNSMYLENSRSIDNAIDKHYTLGFNYRKSYLIVPQDI